MNQAYKNAWQRRHRASFAQAHGYSTSANYATGGLREQVLERDGRKCVRCGMTESEHLARWERPITIDHKDKNRSHNVLDNLQTLCLTCHGIKDSRDHTTYVPPFKDAILAARACGETYRAIADRLGFSIGAIWKWTQRWENDNGQ